MATWATCDHGEWTCPKCGNVYRITSNRYPASDATSIRCECGEEIFVGNSTFDYAKEFVRKGDFRDAAGNPGLG